MRTDGEVRKVLSWVNAASASSVQENFSDAFKSLKKVMLQTVFSSVAIH